MSLFFHLTPGVLSELKKGKYKTMQSSGSPGPGLTTENALLLLGFILRISLTGVAPTLGGAEQFWLKVTPQGQN